MAVTSKPSGRPRHTRKRTRTEPPGGKKRAVKPEDITRIVFLGQPTISNDGTRILVTHKTVGEKNNYETNLWMICADSEEAKQFTAGGADSATPAVQPDRNTAVQATDCRTTSASSVAKRSTSLRSSPSTITRMTGSVPDALRTTRPRLVSTA